MRVWGCVQDGGVRLAVSAGAVVALGLSHGSALAEESESHGQERLSSISEELFHLDRAFVQEQGEIQLTLSLVHRDNPGAPRIIAGLEAEYGVSDWLQLAGEIAIARQAMDGGDSMIAIEEIGVTAVGRIIHTPAVLVAAALETTVAPTSPGFMDGGFDLDVEPSLRLATRAAAARIEGWITRTEQESPGSLSSNIDDEP